jgi:PAS domain S-box-containing protein
MKKSDLRKKTRSPVSAALLRRRAEAQLRKQQKNRQPKAGGRNLTAETQRLLGELQVHQIELEMQNAELQGARDRAEELLGKYAELYDFAPISYFSLDEQGRILEVNLTGTTLLGVVRSRLLNRSLESFAAPASRPILSSFLEQVFSRPETQVCELQLLKADGTAFWASLHGVFAPSGSGPAKCRVAVSDITSLKQAEEAKLQIQAAAAANRDLQREIVRRKKVEKALRQSEERFHQVADAAGEMIWEVDAKGLYTYVSPFVTDILGYTPEELVGKKHFYDLFVLSVREELKAAAFQVFAGRKAFKNFPNPNVSKSGKIVQLETSGTPMLDPTGKLVGYRGADTDITERQRVQETLRQSEQKFRRLYESMMDAFVITDMEGRIQESNLMYRRLLGYSEEELSGLNFFQLTPDSWHPSEARIIQDQILLQGFSEVFEKEYRRKDGTVFPVELRIFLIRDGSGRPAGMWAIVRDITARRHSEQEIAQQSQELAHLSRITALGELAVSLAHELNQPLAAILSNAQAAQHFIAHDNADINEVREILADIVADDKRAGEVIRRLRAMLKKSEVHRRPLNASEVVHEVLSLVRNDLVNHGITVQAELAQDLPVFQGDRVQLQQVLLNLVMNACDAMSGRPQNDRQLKICTGLTGDNFVQISVADRGTGIPPEKLEHVFDPFYTTKPNGMGLGLAVCRTIVDAHAGKLWAVNNPERGSTFHVIFPAGGRERAGYDP